MDCMICTDTGADIFWRTAQQQRIEIAHMHYTLNGKSFTYNLGRGTDISSFYYAMQNGANVSTIPVLEEEFLALWHPTLHGGRDVLYIGISSKLSHSFNAARAARQKLLEQYPDRKIVIIDTLSCSVAQGLLAFEAAHMLNDGKDIFEAAEWVVENRAYVHGLLLIEDSTRMNIPGIKPRRKPLLLRLDAQGGAAAEAKCRDMDEAIALAVEYVGEKGYALKDQVIAIAHADALERAEAIKEKLVSDTACERTAMLAMGPITGCYAGQGAIAVSFFGSRR